MAWGQRLPKHRNTRKQAIAHVKTRKGNGPRKISEKCPPPHGTFSRYAYPMRMNLFRRLLLVWMLAWLPVSGVMAVVMPISGMFWTASAASMAAGATNAPATDTSVAVADAIKSSMPCHGPSPASDKPPSGTCTHCVLCHLAVSLMLPSLPVVQGIALSRDFSATPLLSHTSFFPDPASPPPRTRNS